MFLDNVIFHFCKGGGGVNPLTGPPNLNDFLSIIRVGGGVKSLLMNVNNKMVFFKSRLPLVIMKFGVRWQCYYVVMLLHIIMKACTESILINQYILRSCESLSLRGIVELLSCVVHFDMWTCGCVVPKKYSLILSLRKKENWTCSSSALKKIYMLMFLWLYLIVYHYIFLHGQITNTRFFYGYPNLSAMLPHKITFSQYHYNINKMK